MQSRISVCLIMALSALIGFTACKKGVDARHDDAAASTSPASNPVQIEMRALHEGARAWLTAVSFNSLDSIPPTIEKIHAARNATEAALEQGTYKPPRNGERLDDFKRADEAFHAELVAFLGAAKDKDLVRTTHQLGVVLDRCTDCHQKFRF